MLQNTSKTLGFKKIMVYKTKLLLLVGAWGVLEVNHIWIVAYYLYKILFHMDILYDFSDHLGPYTFGVAPLTNWCMGPQNSLNTRPRKDIDKPFFIIFTSNRYD